EMVLLELRDRAGDPGQLSRVSDAVDAYAFPFVGTAMQRIAYEFGSSDKAWTPRIDDAVLSHPDSLEAAARLRTEQQARGLWVAARPEESSARPRAERALEEFTSALH